MTYTEMRSIGIKQMSDIFHGLNMTKSEQEKVIFGFCTGFLMGETHQIEKRLKDTEESYERIINSIKSS